MISSRHLSSLLPPARLEAVCQSAAMLDAILSPEWEYRYFSFNSRWDVAKGERMASMRNGSGDHYFAVFSARGAIMKGFDHEALMSPWSRTPQAVWPGVLDAVPKAFEGFLKEPAFSINETTFCLWCLANDIRWASGNIDFPNGDDPDGSLKLLLMLDGNPNTYAQFAREYYERELQVEAVTLLYDHVPLGVELMTQLNPEAAWTDVVADAAEIGYPVAGEVRLP